MTAALDLRSAAHLFGWEVHVDEHRKEDTFIFGPNMLAVNYRRDGTVDQAYRYLFYRIDKPKLQEKTPLRSKKSTILAWLAGLGH
jgi:hypothetical protein